MLTTTLIITAILCVAIIYAVLSKDKKEDSEIHALSLFYHHRDFVANASLLQGKQELDDTVKYFKQEVDRILNRIDDKELLNFFVSIDVRLEYIKNIKNSHYAVNTSTIWLCKQQAYTLLHELLHAYWHKKLTTKQRLEVAEIYRGYKKKYPKTDEYYLINVQEFWAGCGVVFLTIDTTFSPFNPLVLYSRHEEMFMFLCTIFKKPLFKESEKNYVHIYETGERLKK